MSRRPVAKPGVATSTTATPGAAEQLDEPGREPALREGAHVAAESAILTPAEEVVHESEEPEPERREQHQAAGQREAGILAQPGRAQDRPPRLDDEHGQDDEDAAGGRKRKAAVVGALERREREHLAARRCAGTAP